MPALSGEHLEQPARLEYQRQPPAVPAGVPSSTTRTTIVVDVPRPYTGAWIGDTWRVTGNLDSIKSMCLRYDLDLDGLNPPGVKNVPIYINDGFYPAGNYGYQTGVKDLTDFGPRGGFAYSVGGKSDLVIRGGTGIYYNFPVSNVTYRQQFYNQSITADFLPGSTPNFSLQNPTGGVTATQILSGAPLRRRLQVFPRDHRARLPGDPRGWQTSIGFQKQLGTLMEFDLDYTDLEELHQVRSTDVNLFYNPATGYNLDPTLYGRPNNAWGEDEWLTSDGKTQTRNLAGSFTRRFSQQFSEMSVTDTRSASRGKDDTTGFGYTANNQFNPLADWATSTSFQRETFRMNGIVMLPRGMDPLRLLLLRLGQSSTARTSGMDPCAASRARTA